MSQRSAVVIGAGIVGLATAHELGLRGYRVTVLDKEKNIAGHQTGHNSGVIHSGLYYTPGSLKARLAVAGARSMTAFAQQHGLPVDICGKLVVATNTAQVPALRLLAERGQRNGVPCRRISSEEAREYEPHVRAVDALHVESTGVVSYTRVSETLVSLIRENGGEVRLSTQVVAIATQGSKIRLTVKSAGSEEFLVSDLLVNCAGLHSDRIARLAGLRPAVRILPFRGEYYELKPEYAHHVRGLVYPVPDPALPFLGVHLTRMVDQTVHAGPNAVLALAREGYRWRDVDVADLLDALRWPGLWHLARRYWRTGVSEVGRSLSPRLFLASLRELVPDLPDDCLRPAHAGVRAQAVHRDGRLVDDFYYERLPGQVHVLNAPSPAATAALEIGRHVAQELEKV